MNDEEEEKKSTFILFGRDLLKIPCFRDTYLVSIPTYFGVSLLAFLITSRGALSSHIGFASFTAVTFGYYINCRKNYEIQKFQYGQIQRAMHKAAILEGTMNDSTSDGNDYGKLMDA